MLSVINWPSTVKNIANLARPTTVVNNTLRVHYCRPPKLTTRCGDRRAVAKMSTVSEKFLTKGPVFLEIPEFPRRKKTVG